jgi:hypothetical protein
VTTYVLGTTLRLTAHLWRRRQLRGGGIVYTSACGAVHTLEAGVDPYMRGDKLCRRCFPKGMPSPLPRGWVLL